MWVVEEVKGVGAAVSSQGQPVAVWSSRPVDTGEQHWRQKHFLTHKAVGGSQMELTA